MNKSSKNAKQHKKVSLRLLATVCIIIFSMSNNLSHIHVNASKNKTSDTYNLETSYDSFARSFYLVPTSESSKQEIYQHGSSISLNYQIMFDGTCDSYDVKTECDVPLNIQTSINVKSNIPILTVDCSTTSDQSGTMCIYVNAIKNNQVVSTSRRTYVYIYPQKFGDFVNLNCMEDAIQASLRFQLTNHMISSFAYQRMMYINSTVENQRDEIPASSLQNIGSIDIKDALNGLSPVEGTKDLVLPETNDEATIDESTASDNEVPVDTETSEVVDAQTPVETEASEVVETQAPVETETSEVVDTQAPAEAETSEVVDTQAPVETEASEVVDTATPVEAETSEVVDTATTQIPASTDSVNEEALTDQAITNAYAGTENPLTVSGLILWTDANGTSHPAKNVKIEILDEDGSTNELLGTTYTNRDGQYRITVANDLSSAEGGCDIKIRASAEGGNIQVKNSSGTLYSKTSAVTNNVTAQSIAKSVSFNSSSTSEQAFQVHQSFQMASSYVYSVHGSYLPTVTVSYPDSSRGTSCYVSSEQKIYLLAGDYCDWDVEQHEYGHHVQHCLGTANSPGGSHSSSNNLADSLGNKSSGIRLAWGEGWATYFAISLQQVMKDANDEIINVGDNYYQDTIDTSITLNIETGTVRGEANELSVCAVLYDLYDPENEDHDSICLGDTFLFNIVKNNQITILSDCIRAVIASTNVPDTLEVGNILSNQKVSPELLTPSNNSTITSTSPKFTWSAGGGSTSGKYNNNSFQLEFYDSSNILIFQTAKTTATSYTLTSTEYNKLLQASGNTFKWCVLGSQTTSPSTGPYYSNYRTVYINKSSTQPSPDVTTITTGVTKSGTLAEGDCYWYKFTAPSTKTYTFASTGSTDTYGELFNTVVSGTSTANRVAYNDDGGSGNNFSISYSLTAGQVIYLRVHGYNWKKTGSFQVSVS